MAGSKQFQPLRRPSMLKGKTVRYLRMRTRGHYDYREYVMAFTDGTRICFSGNSNAHCDVDLINKSRKLKGKT